VSLGEEPERQRTRAHGEHHGDTSTTASNASRDERGDEAESDRERGHRSGAVAAIALAIAWLVVLGTILSHRIFVSSDTISNYAHVWFVSRVMVRTHGIPYHMAIIGHGQGLAFPYAFLPWVTAALLRPWLGDWVVTLWLVVGSIGLIGTTFWAFPELRRGWWWIALVLANPFLIVAPVLGQLPFVWAMAFGFAAIACWRGGHTGWAIVLAGAGQATHAAVVLPILAIVVALWLRCEPERRKLLVAYAASLVIAAPAVALVFLTPAYADSSTGVKVVNFVETVAPRLLVVLVPMGLVWLRRRGVRPWMAPALLAAMLATSLVLASQLDTRTAWRDLHKSPETSLVPFIRSAAYRPGLEYRVLSTTDRRMGMYLLIEHGARLDSEFFPESIVRRTWPSAGEYCAFLRARRVDRVVVYTHYDSGFHKNEGKLLRELALDQALCAPQHVTVTHIASGNRYDVYGINRP
jgi:hypothetical protein